MPEQVQYEVPHPSQDIFLKQQRSQVHQVLSEKQVLFIITKIEYPEEGGIYIHYQGVPDKYSRKGFPFPEAIAAINSVKRHTIGYIKVLANKRMVLPLLGFVFTPWKVKMDIAGSILREWVRQADWHLNICYLEPKRYTAQTQEIKNFVEKFLDNLGLSTYSYLVDKPLSEHVARVLQTLIEYDDSYRYRVEDIFSSVDTEKLLKNPRKEIRRVFNLYLDREHSGITEKFGSIVRLLTIALYLPRVKRAFRKAVRSVDISKMGLDEADSYWVKLRNDYDYQGKSFEQRQEEYKKIHGDNLPPRIFMN